MPTPFDSTDVDLATPVASTMRRWLERERHDTLVDLEIAAALGNEGNVTGCYSDLRTLTWLLSSLNQLEDAGEPDEHAYAEWYATNAEPSGFRI